MRVPALLLPAAALAGCAASPPPPPPAPPVAPEVRAVEAAESPVVDGTANDSAWAGAPEAEVPLVGIAGPPSCLVKAVVHRGTLHLLVRWKDATEDREHKPWVRSAAGEWTKGLEREDVLSVAFPLEGEFTADMLSPVDAAWDVWHWKAGRTDPVGRAQDRVHRMTLSDPGGERHAQVLPDGRTVHIRRPEDEGGPSSKSLPAPAEGDRGPSHEPLKAQGSAADVVARGTWSEGWWTLELARALRTGHPDDRDLEGLREIPFALATLDRAENEDHAASPVLRLVLPVPAPRDDAAPGEGSEGRRP